MGLYAKYVLPKLIDVACGQKPMAELRAEYVPRAEGNVLEIGIGSGHNLGHYRDANTVTGLDPAPELTTMASRRAAAIDAEVSILQASGEDIPADSGQFDSIVCTWTLCSIPDVSQALQEMRRVLKARRALLLHRARARAGAAGGALAAGHRASVEDHRRRLPPHPATGPAA